MPSKLMALPSIATSATPITLPTMRSGAATPASSITPAPVENRPKASTVRTPRGEGSHGKLTGRKKKLLKMVAAVPASAAHAMLRLPKPCSASPTAQASWARPCAALIWKMAAKRSCLRR